MVSVPPGEPLRGQFKVLRVGARHRFDAEGESCVSVAGFTERDGSGAVLLDASAKPDHAIFAEAWPQRLTVLFQAMPPAFSLDR